MNRLNHSTPRAPRGFTLVEIMVALALGLFLMAGVGRLFLGNQDGYRLQTGMARLQENARFALDILKRDIGQAGFPRGQFGGNPVAGVEGGGNLSDSITVSYEGATDCLGAAPAAAPTVVNLYDISAANGQGIRSFRCNGTALADGIDNMQLLYGIDTDADLDIDPDRIPNSYVSVPADWSQVVSVRVSLLVNTVDDDVADSADDNEYELLNAAPIGPFNDRRERRVFTSTILLRNPLRP